MRNARTTGVGGSTPRHSQHAPAARAAGRTAAELQAESRRLLAQLGTGQAQLDALVADVLQSSPKPLDAAGRKALAKLAEAPAPLVPPVLEDLAGDLGKVAALGDAAAKAATTTEGTKTAATEQLDAYIAEHEGLPEKYLEPTPRDSGSDLHEYLLGHSANRGWPTMDVSPTPYSDKLQAYIAEHDAQTEPERHERTSAEHEAEYKRMLEDFRRESQEHLDFIAEQRKWLAENQKALGQQQEAFRERQDERDHENAFAAASDPFASSPEEVDFGLHDLFEEAVTDDPALHVDVADMTAEERGVLDMLHSLSPERDYGQKFLSDLVQRRVHKEVVGAELQALSDKELELEQAPGDRARNELLEEIRRLKLQQVDLEEQAASLDNVRPQDAPDLAAEERREHPGFERTSSSGAEDEVPAGFGDLLDDALDEPEVPAGFGDLDAEERARRELEQEDRLAEQRREREREQAKALAEREQERARAARREAEERRQAYKNDFDAAFAPELEEDLLSTQRFEVSPTPEEIEDLAGTQRFAFSGRGSSTVLSDGSLDEPEHWGWLRQEDAKPAKQTLFVIGDTHGDLQFLCQALLATGQFELPKNGTRIGAAGWQGVVFKEPVDPTVTTVVAGDMSDRGLQDMDMLYMLIQLTNQHPDRLKILMGNHEEMALQHDFRYAPKEQKLSTERLKLQAWRTADRQAGFDLGYEHRASDRRWVQGQLVMQWVRTLDVAAKVRNVLMAHGGLSADVWRQAASDVQRLKRPSQPAPPPKAPAPIDGPPTDERAGRLHTPRVARDERARDERPPLRERPPPDAHARELAREQAAREQARQPHRELVRDEGPLRARGDAPPARVDAPPARREPSPAHVTLEQTVAARRQTEQELAQERQRLERAQRHKDAGALMAAVTAARALEHRLWELQQVEQRLLHDERERALRHDERALRHAGRDPRGDEGLGRLSAANVDRLARHELTLDERLQRAFGYPRGRGSRGPFAGADHRGALVELADQQREAEQLALASPPSAEEILQFLNDGAKRYYARNIVEVKKCYQQEHQMEQRCRQIREEDWQAYREAKAFAREHRRPEPQAPPDQRCSGQFRRQRDQCIFQQCKPPYFLAADGAGGLTWYRGYTSVDPRMGEPDRVKACRDAAVVGKAMGVATMAYGHTAHDYVTHFCGWATDEWDTAELPVVDIFAVDTHAPFSCADGECDVEPATAYIDGAGRGGAPGVAKKLPTALRLQWHTDDADERAAADTCVWADLRGGPMQPGGPHAKQHCHERLMEAHPKPRPARRPKK